MSACEPILKNLALAAMNLDAGELDALDGYGSLPDIAQAAEFGWWLRAIAVAERNRRVGCDVSLPIPSFDMMSSDELADSLVAAAQVASGTTERLHDLADPILQIVVLHAALALKATNVYRSN